MDEGKEKSSDLYRETNSRPINTRDKVSNTTGLHLGAFGWLCHYLFWYAVIENTYFKSFSKR